jgi:hypothetical protein
MNTQQLETLLCQTLCANASIVEREEGCWRVSTPFTFPDGDAYTLYLKTLPTGGLRISDMGGTLMHMSYENDIDKFREGTRGRLFGQVLSEMDLSEDEGEFFIDSTAQELGMNLLRFGQGLTRIHDLTFLNRLRVESTFYEDLREKLRSYVDADKIHEQYTVENVPNNDDYPVDYYIEGGRLPLYLFGVPNRDKARLATIVLQHLNASSINFDSMIVFQNMTEIPARDLSRLTNAANDMIASLDAASDFERKLLRRVK